MFPNWTIALVSCSIELVDKCFQEEWEPRGIDRHIFFFSPKDEIFLVRFSFRFASFGVTIIISS